MVPDAGHLFLEPGITYEIVRATDKLDIELTNSKT